jgi:hypothetical protein
MHPLADTIAAAKDIAAKLATLDGQTKALQGELAVLEESIEAFGLKVAEKDAKGTVRAEIVTESGTVKLTWPLATLKLTEDNFAEAKKLAGAAFGKIAEKIPVTHKLVKAARDLIPALLSKASADKLLKLLGSTPAAPRVSYS